MESCKRPSRTHKNTDNIKTKEVIAKKRLYTSNEVCQLFGVSLQSLRRAIATEKIKTIRLRRFLRIPSEEVEKMVQGETSLLTVAEAANLLSVSAFIIRQLIKKEKIKAFRLANKGPFKIAKSDVERIVHEGISL